MERQALYDAAGVLLAHGTDEFKPAAGQFVREVPEDFALRPGAWRWDGSTHVAWQSATDKRAAIDDARDRALLEGVAWNGKTWHTDATFQTHITGLVGAFTAGILPAAATVNIRAMDNSISALNATQVKQLAGAVMQRVQQVYADSWAAKDAL